MKQSYAIGQPVHEFLLTFISGNFLWAGLYQSTLHTDIPELPDKPTLPEDCGTLVGCCCLPEPVAAGGLERFTIGNLVPTQSAVSIRRLVATGVGKLRSTFCTSNLLQKSVQYIS